MKFLSNLKHPAAIAALLFSLALPALIAWMGNVGLAGQDMKDILGKLDLNLPFWLFSAQALLFVILTFDLWKDLLSFSKSLNPGKKWLIALGGFVVVATLATTFWIEPRHRVQSDESIFLSTAQNLYSEQVSGACDEGMFENGKLECTKSANNFKARGLAFVYMLGMPIFGTDLQWIFPFHLVLYMLTGLLAFFSVFAWTRNPALSLLTSVILIVQPTVMFQFRSSSVEPLYIFLGALALIQMKWAFEKDSVRHWVLLALTLAFFAQTRQETAFCLGAFVLLSLPRLLSGKDLRFPAFLSTLALFSVPVLLTISFHQGYNFQGGEFEAHGNFLKDIGINWKVITQTPVDRAGLLGNPFLSNSAWLALFGGIALVFLAFTQKKEYRNWLLFLVLYHIQTYMVFENVSGDFTIEINQRYSLVFMHTLAFLAALFLTQITITWLPRFLGSKEIRQDSQTAFMIAVTLAIIMTGLTFRYSDSFKANVMYNRNHLTTEEHAILKWVRSQDDKPRLFVYARPWHFIGYGYSSVHYDKIRNMGGGELDNLIKKFNGEVYYVRGLDCWDRETWHKKAVERRIGSTCDDFERKFEVEPAHQELITNNYLLQISKLKGTKDYDLQSLVNMGILNYLDKQNVLLVSYQLQQVQPRGWRYQVLVNDSVWKDQPYEALAVLDTIAKPNMKPGYNTVSVRVLEANGVMLTQRDLSAFFPMQGAVPLTRLTPKAQFQSWGELGIDKSVAGNPLQAGGRTYQGGLGTHAFSGIQYDLGGKFNRFTAIVGQDQEEMGGDGVQFRLVGDGKLLWSSPTLIAPQTANVDVSVAGVSMLELQVDSLGNNFYDHADWLNPTLIGK